MSERDELYAIVRQLAKRPAPSYRDYRGNVHCGFCAEILVLQREDEHDAHCLWVRARHVIAQHEAATE